MKKSIFVAGVALATLTGANAYAATIDVSTWNDADFNAATAGTRNVENFERYDVGEWDNTPGSTVGTFGGLGGTGSGTTCSTHGTCDGLWLSGSGINGQDNIWPTDGTKALSTNDTLGIDWRVSNEDNSAFDKIVFGMQDASDQGATVTITAEWFSPDGGTLLGSVTQDFTSADIEGTKNGNKQLVVIDLGGLFTNAKVTLKNSKTNDAFTIDAASTVSSVPLPAAAWLFLSGLGVLGAIRKRKQNFA